jgi:hypothetical protein
MEANSKISAETISSLLLLQAVGKKEDSLTIERISASFDFLGSRGIQLAVALRRVSGGLYSEDVEVFAGRLCATGYARFDNHGAIVLAKDGIRICREIVIATASENPEELRTIVRALDIDWIAVVGGMVL